MTGSFQGSATQSSRKVPISHKRSPERTTKKKATGSGSNQPTQVVFEAWVNSLCTQPAFIDYLSQLKTNVLILTLFSIL